MLDTITRKLFAMHKIKGVGPATLTKLLERPGFDEATVEDLMAANKTLARALNAPGAWQKALEDAEEDIDQAERSGVTIVSCLDESYPRLLKETPDRPFFLYVRGRLPPVEERNVAVIGTRAPTPHGRLIAERVTGFLVGDGWDIISGLALGCDGIAHECALRERGRTIAVLAHGHQTIAPRQHRNLAEQILAEGGALVTEYGFGVEPLAHQFVKRDRIQAGLSRGVVLIQSDLEGGSLHACRAALEYNRVLAVACPTRADVAAGEAKVQANERLCERSDTERRTLLKCKQEALDRVLLVRGKADYDALSQALLGR